MMSEHKRRLYNKDCAAMAALEKEAATIPHAVARQRAIDRLKTAWVSFDEKWNDSTPTDAQMARWLQSIVPALSKENADG